jgi:hypothetical protein
MHSSKISQTYILYEQENENRVVCPQTQTRRITRVDREYPTKISKKIVFCQIYLHRIQ